MRTKPTWPVVIGVFSRTKMPSNGIHFLNAIRITSVAKNAIKTSSSRLNDVIMLCNKTALSEFTSIFTPFK